MTDMRTDTDTTWSAVADAASAPLDPLLRRVVQTHRAAAHGYRSGHLELTGNATAMAPMAAGFLTAETRLG
jgi:hypothetical protein